MSFRPFDCCLVAISLSCPVLGCFSSSLIPPETVPVSGSVMCEGKAVPGIRVRFHPQFEMETVGFIPYGETGPDGKFLLNTGAAGNGAPQGEYLVTLELPHIDDTSSDGLETEIDGLKGAYSDPEKSKWKVTLVDGDNLLPPFEIQRPR
ncbi:MAG: hypothetical protein R3C17_19665 [Planctomycetaceae bacterium]